MSSAHPVDGNAKASEDGIRVAAYVRESLTNQKYSFEHSKTPGIESLLFAGKKFQITAAILCGARHITILATLPILIEKQLMPQVLELLNLRNCDIAIGGFEFYPEGRKVWFKVGLRIPPLPEPDYLEQSVVNAVANVDSLTDDLLRLISPSNPDGAPNDLSSMFASDK